MRYWLWLADAVAVFHAAYVAFVVLGFGAIIAGGAMKARWARNFWFRIAHLAAMALVLAETIVGMNCPLTVLENRLRVRSGDVGYAGDFLAYWTHRLTFYSWPAWVFGVLYLGMTAAIGALFVLIPPELHRRRAPGLPPRRGWF